MKRKHIAAPTSSRKRAKGAQSTANGLPHDHGDIDEGKFYKVRGILDERAGQYLFDWEDDEVTGESYTPTWEPKKNANKQAIDDWKRQKALKAQQDRPVTPNTVSPKRPRGRPRKIIESSPLQSSPEISPKIVRLPLPKKPVLQREPPPPLDEPEIVESQPATEAAEDDADSPLFEPETELGPAVEISDPPSSYQAGEYQKLSSSSQPVPISNGVPASSDLPGKVSADQQHPPQSVPVNFGEESRVIPDSQSLVQFSSSAPAAASGSARKAKGVDTDSPHDRNNAEEQETSQPPPHSRQSQTQNSASATPTRVTTQAEELPSHTSAVHESANERQIKNASQPLEYSPSHQEAEPLALSQVGAPASSAVQQPESSQLRSGAAEESQSHNLQALDSRSQQAREPQSSPASQSARQLAAAGEVVTNIAPDLPQSQDHSEPASNGVQASLQQPPASENAPVEDTSPTTSPTQHQTPAVSHRTPTSFQRPLPTQSTASSFPFQTQLPRPATSGSAHSDPASASRLFTSLSGRALSVPPVNSTPVRNSSPIASLPPYSIGTIGESAPPRPSTPSSPLSISGERVVRSMESSQDSVDAKAVLKARLAAIRPRTRASVQPEMPTSAPSEDSKPTPAPASASQNSVSALEIPPPPKLVSSLAVTEEARRSPSAVPAMEPLPVITQEEMNTSERYETLFPGAHDQSNGTGPRHGSIAGASLSRQQSKAEDGEAPCYNVPIALVGHQRDQYPQTAHHQKELIEKYLATSSPDSDLVAAAEDVVQTMRNITLHPDLENFETYTQFDVSPSQEAQWYVDCSAKFRFLRELLNGLRDQTLHIVIVTQPGRIGNMLNTFLAGEQVPHRSLKEVTGQLGDHDGLMVTTATTDDRPAQSSPADLVVLLDPTVSTEIVRRFVRDSSHTIMCRLMVPNSIEHIEDSVSTALAHVPRLRTILSALLDYRNEAGKIEGPNTAPQAAAQAIARFLATQDDGQEWPLPSLEPLANLDSQTESDIDHGMHGSAGSKRPFEEDHVVADDEEPSKRARVEVEAPAVLAESAELPLTINPQEIEFTHISDSVTKPTQSTPLSDTEQRLQNMLKAAQERLDDHVQALSDLQYRHEEQHHQLASVRNERDAAIATAQNAVTKMSEAANNVSALKAQRTALEQRLQEANAKLLDHSIPERAEFERVRLEAEQAKAERDQLDKRLESTKNDLDYVRSMYQTSSQGAQSLATQNTDLENQIAVLQNKATDEQARLRQMGYDAQTENLRKENKKLNAVLRDREAGMKFRDEEIARLKEAGRGRMNTRGNSVPRSPRLGSPMKMDRGRVSRQGSPVAGELRGKAAHLHPLRNG